MKFNSRSSSEKLVGDLKILKGGRVALLTEDGKYEFATEDVAENVVLPPVGTTLKKVSVRTNGNVTVLYGFAPSRGTQIVRFKGFSHKKDDECAPWTMQGGERKGRDGKKWYQEAKLMFTALLDIIDGDFQNCEVGLSLPYIFSKGKDGMAILDGGSKTIEKIVRFFELCGLSLEDDEFEFEENMLPGLEEVLLEMADDHVFQVEIEGGYVKNATDLPTGLEKHYIKGKKGKAQVEEDDFEDDEEEDEPQPKKSSKRQPEPVDEDEDEKEEEQPKRKASREPVRETARPSRKPVVEEDDEDDEEEEPEQKPARRSFRKSSRDEVI
jgi:hypothetical protein